MKVSENVSEGMRSLLI